MPELKNDYDLKFLRGTSRQIMSCSGTYEKKLKNKYLTFKDCDQMLAKSVTEVNNAIDSHSLASALLAVARVTKMVCDVIIHVASDMAGPGGRIIDVAYGGANLLVDATTRQVGKKTIASLLASNKAKVTDAIFEQYGKKGVAGHLVKTVELIYDLYDMCTSGELGGGEGLVSARNTTTRQLVQIRRQIGFLEIEMQNCGMSLPA